MRTLHYYDKIGLLIPAVTTVSGYRIYSNQNLERLQRILFFRELDFPLKRIKEIINHPSFDQIEARDRWGDHRVEHSNMKIGNLPKGFEAKFNNIYQDLAEIRHELSGSDIAQVHIKIWYVFLNKMGDYSLEAFRGFGQMCVNDERFTRNIDQFGAGLAVFMCDAIAIYADKNNE